MKVEPDLGAIAARPDVAIMATRQIALNEILFRDKVVLVSGGNIDPALHARLVA